MEAGALPTGKLLNSRLGQYYQSECLKCGSQEETTDHIFWTSLEAKIVWNQIAIWWAMDRNQKLKLGQNLKDTMLIFKGQYIALVWKTCVASVLWSLWLRRNNLVFNFQWESLRSTVDLIKFRCFKWLRAELNIPSDIYNIWLVNPQGAALLHKKSDLFQDLTWWNSEFIAYTDGSWSVCNQVPKSGVGGCILEKEGNILFIFSGPSSANSPREAEREAILFVYNAFASQRIIQGRLQINTDCIFLVEEFLKQRAGNFKIAGSDSWIKIIQNPDIKLSYSPRYKILAAHDLAVQGANRGNMVHAWC